MILARLFVFALVALSICSIESADPDVEFAANLMEDYVISQRKFGMAEDKELWSNEVIDDVRKQVEKDYRAFVDSGKQEKFVAPPSNTVLAEQETQGEQTQQSIDQKINFIYCTLVGQIHDTDFGEAVSGCDDVFETFCSQDEKMQHREVLQMMTDDYTSQVNRAIKNLNIDGSKFSKVVDLTKHEAIKVSKFIEGIKDRIIGLLKTLRNCLVNYLSSEIERTKKFNYSRQNQLQERFKLNIGVITNLLTLPDVGESEGNSRKLVCFFMKFVNLSWFQEAIDRSCSAELQAGSAEWMIPSVNWTKPPKKKLKITYKPNLDFEIAVVPI